jgi:hypothetical protein
MTSTHLLAVGMKMSHVDISSAWLKYNNNAGYSVHLSQNTAAPKARYLSVCYSAPTKLKERKDWHGCQAHVHAVGNTRETMEILSLDLNHTCSRNIKGKRNYLTKEIAQTSQVVQIYQPAPAGSTKQFQKMTKIATGVTLKKGQAHNAVTTKKHDSLEAQIAQYMLLPSLIRTYKETDPTGTYRTSYTSCHWDRTLTSIKHILG